MALAIMPPTPASAVDYGIQSGFPSTINAGEPPAPTYAWVINHGPTPVTVTEMKFIPSCSVYARNCAGGIADPGTFSFSSTGTGQAKSACSNMTFNVTLEDPSTGQMSIRRADGQDVELSQGNLATDLDECKVMFTMQANRSPNHDSHPDYPGNQTIQIFTMAGFTAGEPISVVRGDATDIKVPAPVNRPVPHNDFDGDGKSDPTLFGESGNWVIPGLPNVYWGLKGDIPVPADYNGDRKVDRAVYRSGGWYVEGEPVVFNGLKGDLPVPSDYDGDGKADRAVYRGGSWYVHGQPTVYFGLPGDIPVPADYNGDGKSERAVYRNGAWYVEGMPTVYLGLAGDIPVPGDYDGDGDAERAVFRAGAWYVEGMPVTFLGLAGDVPVPGDYDGDLTVDQAVFRNGTWYREGLPNISLGSLLDTVVNLPQSIYLGFF